ncbi:hypothetical protein ACWT_7885 [Actinoplanes sp. SE50]|uniref:hypothetical protein n=1 Tax=unclassified Actinoplanes TaxID=2626549 RepID=UPI00023EDFB2|nr:MULTISPECIES: hypothetical protein [unclassified Actinoplanes]AEV88894.1 hypothetical protein ACPL_8016 [Actinoplanes sp. SE50/110]ATO87300.1 hypothetical protein ACWT_7885 [Actinoplanes sp. SE50]SLM04718.1 hypothetical protein ACSP50_8026 [Actinoplanes sp. SE50/110]
MPLSPFDRGITALAGTFFGPEWLHHGDRFDVLRLAYGAEADPGAVAATRQEALLMLGGLATTAVQALWQAGTRAWVGIKHAPDAGHQWMREIVAFCDEWSARHPGPSSGAEPADDGRELLTSVLALIAEVRIPDREVTDALADCARNCTPDLALRWLLQVLSVADHPLLTASQYDVVTQLAEHLKYGEYVLPDRGVIVAD